jgi:two-component system CheB/CheR fusion protein
LIDPDREQGSTERERRLERQLRSAEGTRRKLLDELQNRSRDTLSVIRSIIRRTAAGSHSEEDFAQHLDARLGAFGRAQAAVTRDPAAGVDLAILLGDELLAHAIHEGDNVSISGPEIRLQPRAAELFALLFNELALNAARFGPPLCDSGRIDISWAVGGNVEPTHLAFRWQETGTRAERATPVHSGYGTELVERTLQYELGAEGRLTHDANGTACTLKVPVAKVLFRRSQGVGGDANGESPPFK